MRRRLLFNQKSYGGAEITSANASPCDLCFYDKINNKVILVAGDRWDISKYPSSAYTLIGIVVVPGSHNVYGDNSCAIVSLKPMSCDSPAAGETTYEPAMYWGSWEENISTLTDYGELPIGNNSQGTPDKKSDYGWLSSDKFAETPNKVQCQHNTDTYYYPLDYVGEEYIPSPYLTTGLRNAGYYQTTSPLTTLNALSDFNGKSNTSKIITQRGSKDYSTWKPIATQATDYPAPSCCDMYSTQGLSQGSWYLPSIGELGYLLTIFNQLNTTIATMNAAYGGTTALNLSENVLWSSTESSITEQYDNVDYYKVFQLNFGDGEISTINKEQELSARAFSKIQIL